MAVPTLVKGNFCGHAGFSGSHSGGRQRAVGFHNDEAILDMVEATMILTITAMILQILKTLDAEHLAPLVVDAVISPNHKTKLAVCQLGTPL